MVERISSWRIRLHATCNEKWLLHDNWQVPAQWLDLDELPAQFLSPKLCQNSKTRPSWPFGGLPLLIPALIFGCMPSTARQNCWLRAEASPFVAPASAFHPRRGVPSAPPPNVRSESHVSINAMVPQVARLPLET
ncbi:unnamed protein product [Angiostrongylus costaricensis]|uniref:Uncharacterized protein n=1 Tax=Angiostrongylus costaricensis TaxID=334426 RepID=A0A0R3PFZ2_ANGCS|nr:unnamed protein product [Angiostrongylus costaricensis]